MRKREGYGMNGETKRKRNGWGNKGNRMNGETKGIE